MEGFSLFRLGGKKCIIPVEEDSSILFSKQHLAIYQAKDLQCG